MGKILWIRFLFTTAFRNLGRAPRRTWVSITAIAAAVCALILFESFVQGVKATFRHSLISTNFAHYQLMKKGYLENSGHDPFGYQIADTAKIRQVIERDVAPLKMFSAREPFFGLLAKDDRTVSAKGLGIDSKQEQRFLTSNRVIDGQHLAEAPEEGIFLGAGLARQLGVKAGDTITVMTNTLSGSLNALDLTVVGLFKTGVNEVDEAIFYIDKKVSERLLRSEGAARILMGFDQSNELPYGDAIRASVAKNFPELKVYHWRDLAGEMFDNSMGWLEKQFAVFRLIIVIIATLSIVNVFTMSLLERTGEFGTLRAIGTHQREVASLIFFESMLQATLGGVVGVALAALLIQFGLQSGITMPPPPSMSTAFHVNFSIPWSGVPLSLLLCVGISGGAGIFPALKIARMNIVQALGRNI